MFDERFARRRAARYRSKGLDRTARRMVDVLPDDDVRGATVLEIGGGVGEIHLELLRRGATSATALELSPAYDAAADQLVEEAGLRGRVTRRLLDIAAEPDSVAAADIVVLHRVVCCYPDVAGLLGAAADHARRHVVFSHPPRNALSRSVVATQNALLRIGGGEFRAFAHPPEAMMGVLADRGMSPVPVHRGPAWQVTAATR
ncbi:methyltransferase domain-containing protein [Blastococcus sp. PRF04-17]|uniref:methyltransferase domain-containing protein n=1 Tax=Blastococcus sp. PRF04-17 TaxID=2933797 RepID=UPI001FF494F8|nr:methyltransferase domain-containing protein [Blastococcus sp. PRF04-17]UOY01659.1 hypothetical protein MVA48_22520 [Blastococcus sp. PRF04-17]